MAGRTFKRLEYWYLFHKRMKNWMGLQWFVYMTMGTDGVLESMMVLGA
jgi:hypothetical protein